MSHICNKSTTFFYQPHSTFIHAINVFYTREHTFRCWKHLIIFFLFQLLSHLITFFFAMLEYRKADIVVDCKRKKVLCMMRKTINTFYEIKNSIHF